jgi:hypothetical protein
MNYIDTIDKLVIKLKREAATLKFVYETSPCALAFTDILPERSTRVTWLILRSSPISPVSG